MKRRRVSHKRLTGIISYDPETGLFTRKVTINRHVKGALVGCLSNLYYRSTIDGMSYFNHVLAWFYVTGKWPKGDIDHINRITTDNRFSNLREATRSQNIAWGSPRKDNKTGVKGVSYHKRTKRWIVQVGPEPGRYKGIFNDKAVAEQIAKDAHKKLYAEFSNASRHRGNA